MGGINVMVKSRISKDIRIRHSERCGLAKVCAKMNLVLCKFRRNEKCCVTSRRANRTSTTLIKMWCSLKTKDGPAASSSIKLKQWDHLRATPFKGTHA